MAITHVNRRGDTYYLREGKTKNNKPKYHFSKKAEGTLADAIPAGYEIYENPDTAQVYLRKIQPKVITNEEIATVENGVRDLAELAVFTVNVKDNSIIVYTPNQSSSDLERLCSVLGGALPTAQFVETLQRGQRQSPMMNFTLVDAESRIFSVERWCFRGSIDGWFPLMGGRGTLEDLVAKYVPHLGKESFYELM